MAGDHFRAFERRVTLLSGQLSLEDGTSHPTQLVNLCLGGACIELSSELRTEDPVRLAIEAPNLWDPLFLAARVVWVQRQGSHFRAGLAFQIESPDAAGWVLDILTLGAYA